MSLRNKQIGKFLASGRPKLLRLAVVSNKRNPVPHVSSVWYLWDKSHFWITTSKDRLKVRAIKANPKVALIVDTDILPYEGVIVEGRAELTKRNLRETTLAIVKKYVPKRHVKRQFDDLMRYPRVLVKIKPEKSIDIMSYRER